MTWTILEQNMIFILPSQDLIYKSKKYQVCKSFFAHAEGEWMYVVSDFAYTILEKFYE